jgi:hypothetical protein
MKEERHNMALLSTRTGVVLAAVEAHSPAPHTYGERQQQLPHRGDANG